MYTASPDEPAPISDEERQHKRIVAINNKMVKYSKRSAGELFAGISIREPVEYKGRSHRPTKKKGGSPPRDFELTETFCDFCKLVRDGQFAEARPIYFYLVRFSGG